MASERIWLQTRKMNDRQVIEKIIKYWKAVVRHMTAAP